MISEIHWTKPTRFNRITQTIECYIICRCNKKCYKHPRSFFSLLVQPRILLLAITFSYTGFHVSISMHLYFDMFLYLYLGTITGILCLTDYHLQLALLSSVFATSVGFFQEIGAHRSKWKNAGKLCLWLKMRWLTNLTIGQWPTNLTHQRGETSWLGGTS